MTELDDLEEIARQTTPRVNTKTRNSHRSGVGRPAIVGYVPPAHIIRAAGHAAHPETPAVPEPAPQQPSPEPIRYPAFGQSMPVTSYTELIEVIKSRIAELGIKYENFDALADFPDGLSGKAFGPAQVKRLGPEKLFDALRAASLMIRIEPDPEQLKKMRKEMDKHVQIRHGNQARYANHASTVSSHVLRRAFKHISRLGSKKRWAKTSKVKRSAHASMMANARWKKKRRADKAKRQGAAHRAANAEKCGTVAP